MKILSIFLFFSIFLLAEPAWSGASRTVDADLINSFGASVLFGSGVNMQSHSITNVTDPSSAQDASTKNYVDTQLAQLNPADSVQAASTANIAGTYVNSVSGVCIGDTFTTTATSAFATDGYTVSVGDRILFKNQTSTFQDGVWVLTAAAVNGVSGAVFTRALDMDSSADFNAGQIIPVNNGTTLSGSSWYQKATNTTCNTSTQNWTLFQNAASSYLLKANNLSDVSSTSTSFANIAPAPGTSGNVLTSSGGAWVSATPAGAATWVQEAPSGTCNGSTTSFTLANTPVSNAAVMLHLDGMILTQGAGKEYTISGSSITLATACASGQSLWAVYTR